MARLVLLLGSDPLTQLVVASGLQTYGYEVAVATTTSEALELMRSRRIQVLVAEMDTDTAERLAFVQAARKAAPALAVIYTTRIPSRLPDRDKVPGAPCLRAPYHPHQLVSLIGQLTGRYATKDEALVA